MLAKLLFLILVCLPPVGMAAPSACPDHYAGGQAPDILSDELAQETRELCNTAFVVLHSGLARVPLWSAEHLTRERVESAGELIRRNAFHVDERLPAGARAELKDYARSGYDRGHMTPSGDMPDETAQYESFSLANMAPQNPENNRHLWQGIESAVRKLALDRGELYVLTGPLFRGDEQKRVGHVRVPSHLFKVVYDPRRQEAAAYLVDNSDTRDYQRISVAKLEQLAGIDLLPGVIELVKASIMALPDSRPHARRH